MCEKVRNYVKESIDVCRNCRGIGTIETPELNSFEKKESSKLYECPICLGSGRVRKTLNIEIIINPYIKE